MFPSHHLKPRFLQPAQTIHYREKLLPPLDFFFFFFFAGEIGRWCFFPRALESLSTLSFVFLFYGGGSTKMDGAFLPAVSSFFFFAFFFHGFLRLFSAYAGREVFFFLTWMHTGVLPTVASPGFYRDGVFTVWVWFYT